MNALLEYLKSNRLAPRLPILMGYISCKVKLGIDPIEQGPTKQQACLNKRRATRRRQRPLCQGALVVVFLQPLCRICVKSSCLFLSLALAYTIVDADERSCARIRSLSSPTSATNPTIHYVRREDTKVQNKRNDSLAFLRRSRRSQGALTCEGLYDSVILGRDSDPRWKRCAAFASRVSINHQATAGNYSTNTSTRILPTGWHI